MTKSSISTFYFFFKLIFHVISVNIKTNSTGKFSGFPLCFQRKKQQNTDEHSKKVPTKSYKLRRTFKSKNTLPNS